MLHKYDSNTLQYTPIKRLNSLIKLFGLNIMGITIVLIGLFNLFATNTVSKRVLKESEILVIVTEHDKFSEEKLIAKIKALHFNFPYIVYAQSLLESDHFRSNVFIENNNLFGMKEALIRIHTSIGSQSGYAYYSTWSESLYDYALYSATYLFALTKEEDYFNYLQHSYAENPNYVELLKNIIKNENLKEKFNENIRRN